MSALPKARVRGFSEEAMRGVGQVQQAEDDGPYYVYTPGEPLHRIDERDGVPHIYPHYARIVESSFNLLPVELSITRYAFVTSNKDAFNPKPMFANPRYAGEIIKGILQTYAGTGVISIQAFAHREPDEIELDRFNQMIMPEPVWYSADEVPGRHIEAWRRRGPDLTKRAKERGGLNLRLEFVNNAISQLDRVPSHLCDMYNAAFLEVRDAGERFRVFADGYLQEADRHVQDRDTSGKGTYDERDRRLQWLLGRAGMDTLLAESLGRQPVVNVTVPQAAASPDDIQRQACPECGEMIAVTAKKCRYCSATITVSTDDPRVDELITEVKETPQQRRERKAHEMRERNGR